MRSFIKLFIVLSMVFNTCGLYAEEALVHRKDVNAFMDKMVKQHHFDRKQLASTLKAAEFQPQIIESMERPYEKKTWDVYRDLFLTPQRVQAGIDFWQANQEILEKAQKKYNVPADIIVAIIGVETLYGKHQGNYRVLDALTTLAFHYPKRSPYFTRELEEFLLLCREHGVPATQYTGSYAGAMGKPQFMPSSYRVYAVNYASGNNRPDLMNHDPDAIVSVANYFHHYGWKMNQEVAQPVNVTGWRYKKIATNTRTPDYAYKKLLWAGIKPVSSVSKPPAKAGLIELITPKGQEYWLAYPNFYVITRYNTSPQYALVVYLFAQQLRNQWVSMKKGISGFPPEAKG
jgi:membrane-bound lytic murein transglycosylase B